METITITPRVETLEIGGRIETTYVHDLVEIIERGTVGPVGGIGLTGSGVNWRGPYSALASYVLNDAVSYSGSSWRALRVVIGVTPVEGADWTIIAVKGDTGPPGTGDLNYLYTQLIASATWNITHNLGKYPNVVVIDSGNTEVEGEVEYVDVNSVILRFSAAFGGTATLN